jgi:hypothetical protein
MDIRCLVLVGACLIAPSALAQSQDAPVQASVPTVLTVQKVQVGSSLPSSTDVWMSLDKGLSSKKIHEGDQFDMTVSRDVMLGDYVVIPRGAHGHGQISYRTGKGAFGKSAKMEFDLIDVKVGDRTIPLTGHYRIEGQGNTGATVGAVVAVGVFSAFVTGHSATAAQGSEWKGDTKEPILVAIAPTTTIVPAVATQAAPAPAPAATPAAVATPATPPAATTPTT